MRTKSSEFIEDIRQTLNKVRKHLNRLEEHERSLVKSERALAERNTFENQQARLIASKGAIYAASDIADAIEDALKVAKMIEEGYSEAQV